MSDLSRRISRLSAVKLAFAAQQVEGQAELIRAEPIAIVGLACRFPGGADDPEAFWSLLERGADAIREVPRDRWDIDALYDPDPGAPGKMCCRYGGFLEGVDLFDAEFFGISPREAAGMDPQQRLLLEVSWEALERANQPADRLFGSSTGVFVGISTFDYAALRSGIRDRNGIDAYRVSGTTFSVAAGRLSYQLGLNGPCLAVDTACSSSLVALHLACQCLRNRESVLALAAGVGLLLAPEPSINFSKAGMLSRDGRCKTFDAAADGYVRGEGCGVAVLKRLSDALADGDAVWAVIRGSAVNQDGASGGLTVPSGPSQEAVIRQALAGGGLEPHQVDYVEAHGTGTSLGDPIEINALAAALCRDRTADRPLIVGSVKTNIGHLEAAAGIAGVIKTVLSLRHRKIPAHLHLKTPNPHIAWEGIPIAVASRAQPWPAAEGRRIAGVSAFGFSGTNAHVLLEEAPEETGPKDGNGRPLHLLTLSAKTEEALDRLAARYRLHLETHSSQRIGDFCRTANAGRSLFSHRLAVIAATREELREKLAALQGRNPSGPVVPETWRSGPVREKGPVRFDRRHGAEELQTELRRLARVYAEGGRIDWDDFYAGAGERMVEIPTYPFLRERFWFETADEVERSGRETGAEGRNGEWTQAPLPGRRLPLPLSREIRFETTFGRGFPALLEDHRLFGTAVVAGASWLAMVFQAVREGLHGEGAILEEVLMERAMTLREGEARSVHTLLLPEAGGRFSFQVLSAGAPDDGEGFWERHVSGKLRIPDAAPGAMTEASAATAAALREEAQGTWEPVDVPSFYHEIAAAGHHLGESFRRLRAIRRRGREALCLLEAPDRQDAGGPAFPPGVIDSCLQFFCIRGKNLWNGESNEQPTDPDATYIPFAVKEARFFGEPRPGERLWCHAAVRSFEPLTQGMTGEVVLFDDDGRTLLSLAGLTVRKLHRGLPAEKADEVTEARPGGAKRTSLPPPGKRSERDGTGGPVFAARGSAGKVPVKGSPEARRPSALLRKLVEAPAGRQRAILKDYVRSEVGGTLRLKPPKRVADDRGLFDLGIDSLMAMELKNRFETDLGRSLPSTLVFDYPTVEALTGYLERELSASGEERPDRDDGALPGGRVSGAAAGPPENLDTAIAGELARLESLLKGR